MGDSIHSACYDSGVISFEQALERVLEAVTPAGSVPVSVASAAGRVLAAPVVADLDFPSFTTTAMDGWAVRTAEAGPAPVRLTVAGAIGAGAAAGPLPAATAMKLMTGAPMAPGADAIVPVEEAEEHEDGTVSFRTAPAPGDHLRRQGEVFTAGATLLSPGRRLSPADLVLAAAAGHDVIAVARPLRAGVLVTGSEVVSAGARPGPAQIRNTNGPLLLGALTRAGAEAQDLGSAPDDPPALRLAIARALASGLDLLLTTGGVSAGDFDLVPEVLSELGARTIFHKVSIKPGKPVLFAVAGQTLVFGVPGNPVSAAVIFDLFVRPVLRRAAGLSPALPPPVEATLTASVSNHGSRLTFAPARLVRRGETLFAEPLPSRGSHDVLAHARSDGLLVIPPKARLAEGDRAGVYVGTGETTLGAFE